jgi:cobalt-zinc-cadmium efflux system outer membrane protein
LGADHDQWAKQTTLQLSEQIETGGKRQSRIEAASADRRAAAVELGAKRLEIFAEVKKTFVEVLFLQEQLTLNEQRQALARQILGTAKTRAEAGRGMKIEVIRAELALADAHISQDRIRDQLNTAQRIFFTTTGLPDAPFVPLRGNLFALPADPARQHPASFEKSPDSTRASAEMGRREAAIKVEEAKAAVAVTVSGGVRYFGTEKKTGIVVGLTVPIPVFNRNSGSIREAYEELEAAKLIYLSNTSKAAALFSTAAQEAATAYREAKSVRETLLPGAKSALAAANEAFQRGKLDYLNVLDAQRAYFESEERQLRALTTYHKAIADLERYAGQNQLSGTVEENANEKK